MVALEEILEILKEILVKIVLTMEHIVLNVFFGERIKR